MKIVSLEAIQEVLPSTPDQLRAYHDVVDRIKQKVTRGIMTTMKCIGRLPVGIRDVQHRVADGTGEALIPSVVEVSHHACYRQGNALDWRPGISRVQLDTNINRRIIHVVLHAMTVNKRELAYILLAKVQS